MSLPQETLALVFSHLGEKELFQCQLTSKQWHNASLRFLYSNLVGDTIERLFMYVSAIANSPQLGEYLNTIDFQYLFAYEIESDEFNRLGLLDSVIKYCPSITKMDGFVDNDHFWSRLMYASTQGQLSRLESLPRTFRPVPKSFIDTSLVFKNTLTSLWVYCNYFDYVSTIAYSAPYEALFNQIDQFQNVNALYIETPGVSHFSYFDKLIDKFHGLKTIDISYTFDLDHMLIFMDPGPTILPRPDIRSLKCYWSQLRDESQLEYLMRKFPNLQRLEVDSWCNGAGRLGPALEKFIQYALSIPDLKLSMELFEYQILDIWAEFIKTKDGCKNVTLCYLKDHPSTATAMYQLELSVKLGLRLGVKLRPNVDELPHAQFLSEAGKSLRSLRITEANFFQRMSDKPGTIAWLFDILQLCPLLEELKISGMISSSSIHHTLQYSSLKKLTIDGFRNMKSIDFLHCLSLSLPNLCQLSLIFDYNNMDSVVIDMPHTSFDLLIWNENSCRIKLFKGPEVYIRLKTDKGLEYYLRERSILVPISESRYLLSPKNVRFDIRCKYLKELRIRRKALPESDSDFIF